jgi:hypothetical protein
MSPKSSPEKSLFWSKHLESQPQSGMSQVAYCKQLGISDKAFTYWKRRFRGQVPRRKKMFIELSDRAKAKFIFPGGAVLECDSGVDPVWLGTLINGARSQ